MLCTVNILYQLSSFSRFSALIKHLITFVFGCPGVMQPLYAKFKNQGSIQTTHNDNTITIIKNTIT